MEKRTIGIVILLCVIGAISCVFVYRGEPLAFVAALFLLILAIVMAVVLMFAPPKEVDTRADVVQLAIQIGKFEIDELLRMANEREQREKAATTQEAAKPSKSDSPIEGKDSSVGG